MKGPLQRLRRRSPRPAPDSEPVQGPSPTPGDDATHAMPVVAQEGAPAGQAPDDGAPSFRHRGRLRRRLRYLRRVRELGFRDLGGLVFDQHRFDRRDEDLLRAKVETLAAVDRELRTLERVLAERRPVTELREPGITVCARCGALPGSDARYCPACGTPQRGARTMAGVGDGSPAPQALAPTAQPVAAAPAREPAAVPAPASTPAPGPSEAPTTSHEATPPSP